MATASGRNNTGCFACLFQGSNKGNSANIQDQDVYINNSDCKSQGAHVNSTTSNNANQGALGLQLQGGGKDKKRCSISGSKHRPSKGLNGLDVSGLSRGSHPSPVPGSPSPGDSQHYRCTDHKTSSSSSSSSSSARRSSGATMKVDKHAYPQPISPTSSSQTQGGETDPRCSIAPHFQRIINVRPSLSFQPEQDINIVNLSFEIDKKLTSIDEKSQAVLKYRTPHFRATAQLEIPGLEDGESVQVGWIQTCLHMLFVNTYGSHGMTSWEFPEIMSGRYKMVSDADGKQYPWYGAKNEVLKLKGPCPPQTVEVEMNDNFFPQVTWYIPDDSFDRIPRLTHIRRKQKFYTFLAVKNLQTGQVHVLKTITWRMELNIGVDPSAPLGKRATLMEPREQQPPELIEGNVDLPEYALKPPNANNSQTLVWRPHRAKPVVIVPPVQSTVAMSDYILQTEGWDMQNTHILRES